MQDTHQNYHIKIIINTYQEEWRRQTLQYIYLYLFIWKYQLLKKYIHIHIYITMKLTYGLLTIICIVLASSSSTSHATSLRGSPDVVLASMNYVLKDAEQEISSTEKDLQEKKDTFKGRVIDEKKVAEKAKKVVQIAEECIKDATVSNE